MLTPLVFSRVKEAGPFTGYRVSPFDLIRFACVASGAGVRIVAQIIRSVLHYGADVVDVKMLITIEFDGVTAIFAAPSRAPLHFITI
jgi:hypothetical protein